MSDTTRFKVYCLEQYKNDHRMSGGEAMRLFRQYGVLDYLGSFYDVLHTYGGAYLVKDIEQFIQARQ